jgi:hypothetical protein
MQTPLAFRYCSAIFAVILTLLLLRTGGVRAAQKGAPIAIILPGGKGGIGFDDLEFSTPLQRVLVPAASTGTLDLIDPETSQVSSIGGFTAISKFAGGHGEGITSVDEGRGS